MKKTQQENQFIKDIIKIVNDAKTDYLDAIITWCHINNVELDSVINVIKRSKKLKLGLTQSAEDLNLLKSNAKSNRLKFK